MKRLILFIYVCCLSLSIVAQKSVTVNNVTCKVFTEKEMYVRVLTSKKIPESDFKKVKKALNISKDLVFFHISGYQGQGEEYGQLQGERAYSYKPEKSKQFSEVKPERIYGDMQTKVGIIAKDFVTRRLKSPKTAKFDSNYIVEKYPNNVYTVLSFVDAENSLGATIRTYFKLKLKWNGEDWSDITNWTLLESRYE